MKLRSCSSVNGQQRVSARTNEDGCVDRGIVCRRPLPTPAFFLPHPLSISGHSEGGMVNSGTVSGVTTIFQSGMCLVAAGCMSRALDWQEFSRLAGANSAESRAGRFLPIVYTWPVTFRLNVGKSLPLSQLMFSLVVEGIFIAVHLF